ncbi:MAG: hypothetical protein ABI995_10755, partial [Acidobacteriota bacterium]
MPLASKVKFTENNQVLANDRPTMLALGLKLENRKISDIETLVTISNPPGGGGGPGGARGGAAALDAMATPDPSLLLAAA